MDRTEQLRMREVHLQLPLTDTAAQTLELGDAVFLSGLSSPDAKGFITRYSRKDWNRRLIWATLQRDLPLFTRRERAAPGRIPHPLGHCNRQFPLRQIRAIAAGALRHTRRHRQRGACKTRYTRPPFASTPPSI